MTPLARTCLVNLWLGLVSVGGGVATVPEMHRLFTAPLGPLTAREFTDGYALGQVAPGPSMLGVVFFSYKAAGVVAAVLAAVLVVAPGVAVSSFCGRAWDRLGKRAWVTRLRGALVPLGLGLAAGGTYVVARGAVTSVRLALLAFAVTVVVDRRWAHPAVAVCAAGAITAALGG